jgi:hypothetical protein
MLISGQEEAAESGKNFLIACLADIPGLDNRM